MLRILGLIPARGGSKGIPCKNIRLLKGKPVLQYTAESAQHAERLARVILSTDDEEIAEVGRNCGLDVPFQRPAKLADDRTPMVDVVRHALLWLEARGERYDAVCLLQPTSPFRPTGLIDDCCRLLEESGADSVITVSRVPHRFHPYWTYLSDPDLWLRSSVDVGRQPSARQALPPAYYREGSVYLTQRDVVVNQNSLVGDRIKAYPIDPSVNLDTLEDWDEAVRSCDSTDSSDNCPKP